jgi:thiol-disulfide isomerase/thioredoxin
MVAFAQRLAPWVVLVALAACAAPLQSAPHPLLGSRPPGADVVHAQKDRVRPPRPSVLEFWSLDCPPCRERVPRLVALQGEFESRGIELVLVAVLDDEQTPADARARLHSWGVEHGTLVVPYATAETRLGVMALPETWVLDQTGRLMWVAPTSARIEDIVRAASRWSRP